MNFLKKIKGWKKISAVMLALIAAILGPDVLGLEPEIVSNIISTLSAYLLGQGIADSGIASVLTKKEAL